MAIFHSRLISLGSARPLLSAVVTALSLAVLPAQAQGTGNPDQQLLEGLAAASIAGIETGKTALEKSGNPEVKKFAREVVDERSAALKEVERLALVKGMSVTRDADMQHKASGTALKLLEGDTFDRQYLSNAGVEDHAQTVALLHKTQREARDPEVRALATRLLPPVQQKLDTARQMAARNK